MFKQKSGFLNHVRAHELSTTAKAAEAAEKEKDVETKEFGHFLLVICYVVVVYLPCDVPTVAI